jgi:hypothetical protein
MANIELTVVPTPPVEYKVDLGHRLTLADVLAIHKEAETKGLDLTSFLIVNSGHGKVTLRNPLG